MTAFVVRTEVDEDVGFLLFARHAGEWPPAGPIDCQFTGAPADAALLDGAHARFLEACKGREWTAVVAYADEAMTVEIDLGGCRRFALRSDVDGNTWSGRGEDGPLRGTGTFL